MTNRDYLRNLSNLSNEKLAEFLKGSKICTCMMETCHDYDDCGKCIKKWLSIEKINVEKGQIRETDSHKWLIVAVNTNRDNCLMLSETGRICDFSTDIVDTWKIITDETEEMFYNRVMNSLYNNKEFNKEYECLYFTANSWVDQ